MKKKLILAILVAIVGAGAGYYYYGHQKDSIKIYGNVEYDYVELAFLDSEKITQLFVYEGQTVRKGDRLAAIDSKRLLINIEAAKADVDAAKYALQKLENGYQQEDIDKAANAVRLAKSQMELAKITYDRKRGIFENTGGDGISRQALDTAKNSYDVSVENYNIALNELHLLKKGPRQEDILQAKAKLDVLQAKLDYLKQQLEDTILYSPVDGFISKRLLLEGELAMPQKPVIKITVNSPVWIRAYVPETMMGKISLGDNVEIYNDSFPGEPLTGELTYISQSAEFTPKSVQTEDLRTSLVYMVKITVKEPQYLKQGMPVTVKLN